LSGTSFWLGTDGQDGTFAIDGATVFDGAASASIFIIFMDEIRGSLNTGLADADADFFVLSDTCYMLNGTDLISLDGTTCTDVVGYIPTVLIGRSPSGAPNAGTASENFNLISAGFKTSFSSTGTGTAYTLPYTSLDATAISAVVDGVAMAEGSGFTVVRATGVVTFDTDPAAGTDNVVITAYKASLTNSALILNCSMAEVFGGKTEATVFVSGNPNFPDQIWHSRLYGSNYNADYFPDNGWQKVPGNVTGLAHIYDMLYVSHSKGHGYLSYLEGTTYPTFPYADINLEKGSDIPGSIQEINNSVICASTDNGVMQIFSNTTLNNRLSVQDISDLINKGVDPDLGLLRETDLEDAVSYNFDGYYGLCVNDVCYVWDYKTNAWLYDTNITASCFAVIDNALCFGSNTAGLVYQFDEDLVNDDGVAISSYIDTLEDCAGLPYNVKTTDSIIVTAKPLSRASVAVSFKSRENADAAVLDMSTSSFSYANFGYEDFTYNTGSLPVSKRKRMRKRATFYQFRLANNVLNEDMSVIALMMKFDTGTRIR